MSAEPQAHGYATAFARLLTLFEVPQSIRVRDRVLTIEARPKSPFTFAARYIENEMLRVHADKNDDIIFDVSFSSGNDMIMVQPTKLWTTIGPAFVTPSARHRDNLPAILRTCYDDLNWLEQNPGQSLRAAAKVKNDIRSAMRL